MYWPCGQDPGRRPEARRRVSTREAMSPGEQSSTRGASTVSVPRPKGFGRSLRGTQPAPRETDRLRRSRLDWFGALGLARKPSRLVPFSTVTFGLSAEGSSLWAPVVAERRR